MLLYQQFFYLLIGLGVLLGLPALWLFAGGMWPAMVERSRAVASRGLLVNFLCGLPLVILVIVLATRAGKFGAAAGVTVAIVAGFMIVWGLVGAVGIAAHVGARLWPACRGDDAWRALLRGSLVVSGVLAIPFIGWYVLLLVLITIGCGMRVRMWFVRDAKTVTANAAPLPSKTSGAPLSEVTT